MHYYWVATYISRHIGDNMGNMSITQELKLVADPIRAKNLQRFFAPKAHPTRSGKTIIGGYGQGDLFLGLKVPQVRQIVGKYWREISLDEAEKLLQSKYHEARQCALFMLTKRFQNNEPEQNKIFRIYIANAIYINNWDLVDLTAGKIVGAYLDGKPKDLLCKFAHSNNLWQRRIAIIATSYYIGKGDARETINIAEILLHDKHDLIHKAVGWMLREVGKRCDEKTLTDFLDEHYISMPRTMLRYAIERLPKKQRLHFLGIKI